MNQTALRNIPAVNDLLAEPPLAELSQRLGRCVVLAGARTYLDDLRAAIRRGEANGELAADQLAAAAAAAITAAERGPLRPVINATGILLHTGLGRAPLPRRAVEAITAVAGGYASVEVDLDTGQRSHRIRAVEELVRQLTGAEAAAVVNNNAGATLIVLAALAAGREVIVSRGQLIEIGGSFRLPDVMQQGGARLREVGTTNKTRLSDFENAITEETAALMRVHTSNYVIQGFTAQPSLEELVALGRERGLPVIDDIGSGAMLDFAEFGLPDEPVAAESLAAGADLILFSGDKLLGGPQCGIIAGRTESIRPIAKHPLMRALRVDKITLAALEATLRLWRDPDLARREVPLLAMLTTPVEELTRRAESLAAALRHCPALADVQVVESHAFVGGGSVPTLEIPSLCVGVAPRQGSLDELAARLRGGDPAVFARVQNGQLLLDVRSVPAEDDQRLAAAVQAAAGR